MRSEVVARSARTAVLAWVLALVACASTVATRSTAPATDLVHARVDEATFALALSAPRGVFAGTPSRADLSIEGRGAYHVNHEYPIRIRLRPTGDVALARTELDASNATELSPDRARFELPFTCRAAGAHRIDADVEFALCTEEACIPQSRTIALTLQARSHRE